MSSKFQKVIILDSPIFLWRFWFLYITFPLWLIFKRCVNFKGPKSCVQWYFRGTHTYTHALSEHRNPLLVSISLKSSDVPVFWRYVPETNHGLPISSFYRILQLYFWTMYSVYLIWFLWSTHTFLEQYFGWMWIVDISWKGSSLTLYLMVIYDYSPVNGPILYEHA